MPGPRMPLVDLGNLTAEQQEVYRQVVAGPRGRFDPVSPLSAWLASPALAKHAQAYGAFARFETAMPRRYVELAILIVAAFWKSRLEWWLHAGPAAVEGLSAGVIESIRVGKAVTFDQDGDAVIHRFCEAMVARRNIPDDVYDSTRALLGASGVVELVGVLGYYSLVAMTTTAFRIPLPEGEADPFPDNPAVAAQAGTIGLIGVGHMGGAIAERMLSQGSRLLVFDTNAAATERLAGFGAGIAASARDVADRAEVVLACLPSHDACLAVANEISAGRSVKIYVEMSTVGRSTIESIAGICAGANIAMVDCPVSGGTYGARAGTLGAMVAGADADIARIEPILRQFATKIVKISPTPGAAQIAKLVNNAISMTAFIISCEALMVGATAGVDPQALIDAVNSGNGRNSATVDKIPMAVLTRKFSLGATIGSAVKDLELYLDEARLQGVPPFIVTSVTELWRHIVTQVGPSEDYTKLITWYERMTGVEFKAASREERSGGAS